MFTPFALRTAAQDTGCSTAKPGGLPGSQGILAPHCERATGIGLVGAHAGGRHQPATRFGWPQRLPRRWCCGAFESLRAVKPRYFPGAPSAPGHLCSALRNAAHNSDTMGNLHRCQWVPGNGAEVGGQLWRSDLAAWSAGVGGWKIRCWRCEPGTHRKACMSSGCLFRCCHTARGAWIPQVPGVVAKGPADRDAVQRATPSRCKGETLLWELP